MDLHIVFENMPYNKDKRISKELLPTLPSCFQKVHFWMGFPRWGMLGQYRCSCMNLHAYEFDNYWEIHKDKNNPFTKPAEHLVEDAPNVLLAIAGIATATVSGIAYIISKRKKTEKKGKNKKGRKNRRTE